MAIHRMESQINGLGSGGLAGPTPAGEIIRHEGEEEP